MNESWTRDVPIEAPLAMQHETTLPAPVNEVFAFITAFEDLPRWMPLMRKVVVDNHAASSPGQVGAIRCIYPPLGKPALETVVNYDAPNRLAYRAADESLFGMWTNHTGLLVLEAVDDTSTRLHWYTFAQPGKNPILALFGRWIFRYVVGTSIKRITRIFHTRAA